MPLLTFDIDFLLNELYRSFYTLPLMIALNILFLVVAVRYRSAGKTHTIFILYATFFLIRNLAGILLALPDKTLFNNAAVTSLLGDYASLCFVLMEFTAFYFFFYFQFDQKRVQHIIEQTGKTWLLTTVLVTLYASIFPFPLTIKSLASYISAFNSVLILTPAFYYFYTLFLEPPTKHLLHEPAFWITTGIAFVHALNIPIFLIEHYMFKQFITEWYSVYFINYIAYCFLFILFIISFLCNRDYKSERSLKQLSTHLS